MIRASFRSYCFGNFVFVTCKCDNFYRGIGFGETVIEALCNMAFYRV